MQNIYDAIAEHKSGQVLVTFYDGSSETYQTDILDDPVSIAYDPAVVEIVDLDTMTVLWAA